MTLKPTQNASDALAERLASLRQLQDEMNAAIAAADACIALENVKQATNEATKTGAPTITPASDT